MAEWLQQMHPLRLQYELFSNANPLMAPVATHGGPVFATTASRSPHDNPFVAMQENASRHIVAALDSWRDMTEAIAERTFLAVYGSPVLQAAVGIDRTPASAHCARRARARYIRICCRSASPSSSRASPPAACAKR